MSPSSPSSNGVCWHSRDPVIDSRPLLYSVTFPSILSAPRSSGGPGPANGEFSGRIAEPPNDTAGRAIDSSPSALIAPFGADRLSNSWIATLPRVISANFARDKSSLQLRVLRLGLLQDGDVGIGVGTSLGQANALQQINVTWIGVERLERVFYLYVLQVC
jgi:hypothetical protein